jgi:hypothetical protein
MLFIISDIKNDAELNLDDRKLLDLGRQDTATPVTVSITVHTTPEFRSVHVLLSLTSFTLC